MVQQYQYLVVLLSLFIPVRACTHSFFLADVTKPLLGVDFFNSFNIGIDTRGRRMYDLSNGDWFGGAAKSLTLAQSVKLGASPTNFVSKVF